MVPFINKYGAVFKKWVTIEEGVKITGGITISTKAIDAQAIIADGDCELNGNVGSVKRLDCKEICAADIVVKDITLSGESLRLKLDNLKELVEKNRIDTGADINTSLIRIKEIKGEVDVEISKLISQINSDRTMAQDSRRALMAQADKDRSENFRNNEETFERISEERLVGEREKQEILGKILALKEEMVQWNHETLKKIELVQLANEDADKGIIEKIKRYRQNNNAIHNEVERRIIELETLFSATEPGDTSLCLNAPHVGQNISISVRNDDNSLTRSMEISGDSDTIGEITVNRKLLIRDAGETLDAQPRKKDVLDSLKGLEKRFCRHQIDSDKNLDVLRPQKGSDSIALGVNAIIGEESVTLPIIVAEYNAESKQQQIGLNTTDPSAPLHVVGDAKFENDILIQQNLFVSGDTKQRGHLQVLKSMYVAGDAKVKGSHQVQKNFYVSGDTKLNGNVQLGRGMEVLNEVKVGGDLHVSENIVTYTNGQRDTKYLNERVMQLENEVAYLKRSLAELQHHEVLGSDIENLVKDYVEIHVLKESQNKNNR